MKRSLLFFFVLIASVLVNRTHAQELTLKVVSVIDSTQKIKLVWQFEDVDSVSIYRCSNQCNDENYFNRIDKVKMDNDRLEWIDNDADPTSLHCYCIGWSFSGKSAPLNNMVLMAQQSADDCFNAVSLSWNPYINMPDSLVHYNIFYRTKTDTVFLYLDSVHGKHNTGFYYAPTKRISFPVKNLKNNTAYEFVIQAVNKSNADSSFSNIVQFETGFEDTARIPIEISCVSVVDDSYIQIDVNRENSDVSFQKLYLLRDESENPLESELFLQFKVIDSLDYEQGKKLYSFKDEKVDIYSKLYYYLAITENKCRFSDSSNVKTNILLRGDRTDKYLDSIQFAREMFPTQDKNLYELYRIVNGNEMFITDRLIRNTTYFIDVTPFIEEGAVVKYQIKSEEGCISNSLIVAHEPVIDFPDAFYPQSRNPENKTFYPILRFPSEDKYLFIIYNRWGQELYRSTLPPVYGDYTNMQGRWDGTFMGKESPTGIYSYQISYRYNEGTKNYNKSGTFMLMR